MAVARGKVRLQADDDAAAAAAAKQLVCCALIDLTLQLHHVVPYALNCTQALLAYLDTEAERLAGKETAITTAAAAAVAASLHDSCI